MSHLGHRTYQRGIVGYVVVVHICIQPIFILQIQKKNELSEMIFYNIISIPTTYEIDPVAYS